MSNNQINKSRLVFRLLVAAGLVSFAAWSVAQIPAGWTVTSDGGCLLPSNQSKLNNEQKALCESTRLQVGSSKNGNPGLCGQMGGKYVYSNQTNRCEKP